MKTLRQSVSSLKAGPVDRNGTSRESLSIHAFSIQLTFNSPICIVVLGNLLWMLSGKRAWYVREWVFRATEMES